MVSESQDAPREDSDEDLDASTEEEFSAPCGEEVYGDVADGLRHAQDAADAMTAKNIDFWRGVDLYYPPRKLPEGYSTCQLDLEKLEKDEDPSVSDAAKSMPWRAICMRNDSITEITLRYYFHRCDAPDHEGDNKSRFDWWRRIMPHKGQDSESGVTCTKQYCYTCYKRTLEPGISHKAFLHKVTQVRGS